MDRVLKISIGLLILAALILPTIAYLTKGNVADHPVYRLAHDLSGGDEALMQTVAALIKKPPTTPKEVGFYGGDKYSERARIYVSVVTRLSDAGFIYSTEDKYIVGLFLQWHNEGLINRDDFSEPAKEVMDLFIDGPGWTEEPDEQVKEELALFLEARYASFVTEVEAQMNKRGHMLLSIDATGGDTMYFALVTPEIGARWRDKMFSKIPTFGRRFYTNGVRAPMWDTAWHNLVYAYLLPVTKPTYTRPVPAGVRLRNKALTSAL